VPAIPCPAGTVITYQAEGNSNGYTQSSNDIISTFQSYLSQNNLALRDQTINATSFAAQINGVLTGSVPFELIATIQTNVDFADVTDVQKICDHGIYLAVDAMPQSSTPHVVLPSGALVNTGQPSQGTAGKPTVHVCGDPSWGFLDDPGQWLTCAFQNTTNTFAFVMVGVILAVILIIAGKHKGIALL